MIEKSGIKKLLFLCPGCYETFKSIYPKLGGEFDFKVEHIVEFLSEFVENNDIQFNELPERITYHDPCHLGRLSGVYEQPRKILKAIPELQLVEMDRIKDNTWCCGAGGGVKAGFKEFALWSATERINEVKATGSRILLTACPFCELNLKDSVAAHKEAIAVKDIIELVDKIMKTS
jgi:heterodisulfide reductase subunit D